MMEKAINDEIAEVLISIQEVNQRIANKLQSMADKEGEYVNGKNKTDFPNYRRLRPTD
ncbi:hypothetical protein IR145_12215 [Streptococcus danieliae]|nr:hypothetical protein [Streptococcus danieliae]